ncbi:hypothetical protein [Coxiella burnetii]|uniref:hypothetical protein n=2 Tax=Coxiella burnetii TaxID=777 RepID=UPI0012FD38B9|nr:hypothetical protein [Coxiella burnetii]
MTMKKDELNIPLFKGLNKKQIQTLYANAKSITLKAGNTLFSESEKAESFYIIGSLPFPLENFIKPRVKLMKFPHYRKITPLEKWY